jgi:hypothetical protein
MWIMSIRAIAQPKNGHVEQLALEDVAQRPRHENRKGEGLPGPTGASAAARRRIRQVVEAVQAGRTPQIARAPQTASRSQADAGPVDGVAADEDRHQHDERAPRHHRDAEEDDEDRRAQLVRGVGSADISRAFRGPESARPSAARRALVLDQVLGESGEIGVDLGAGTAAAARRARRREARRLAGAHQVRRAPAAAAPAGRAGVADHRALGELEP